MLDLSKIWPEMKVVAKLGEGSFGRVYKCEREELGMKLESAVKVISIPANRAEYDSVRKECSSDEEVKSYYSDIVSDFSNEIRMMLMLKGAPNVVSVEFFKIVEHEDGVGSDIYICMEYLTCFSEYARSHSLTEKDVLHLGREICNALVICSEKGIIHRDIKPDNIFIDSYGSFKLGDFGVARRLEGSMSMMSKKGTYSYMAPEVFRGEKYDSRADIYSLGMVLYKLLNRNRDPFVDLNKPVVGYNDRTEAFERRKNGERLPAPVDASPAVAAIILKACAFRAEDRYATVADFRQALKAAQENPSAEEPTVISNDNLEETVVARNIAAPVMQNVQAGYGDETVAVNTYARQALAGNETVILNRSVPVAPTYIQNTPPIVNTAYSINAPLQKPKSLSKGILKWVIIAAVVFAAVFAAVYFAVTEIGNKKQEEEKQPTTATTTVQEQEEEKPLFLQEDTVISAGEYHTVGLRADGTVIATGDNTYGQCDVMDWKNIVAVSAGMNHTVGLKANGKVVAAGYNMYSQCEVNDWSDITAISAGEKHTVGLKSDGTVIATGDNSYGQCDVDNWADIVAVSVGSFHTIGLKSDGTVVAAGSSIDGRSDVDNWKDIVAISVGYYHTVGLKSDGTVIAVGYNNDGQCNVEDWVDIVAVSASFGHTVGLKSDGTVVAVGDNGLAQCHVDAWEEIIAVSAGFLHTVGLKSDGTVVAAGNNHNGQSNAKSWYGIKLPE